MKRLALLLAAVCSASVLALASPALGLHEPRTVSRTVGPVDVPPVRVMICVDDNCVKGPAATSVTLTVSATTPGTDLFAEGPRIDHSKCATGRGAVLVVKTGTVGANIVGTVKLTVDGTTHTIPLPETVATPDKTVTFSVCTG